MPLEDDKLLLAVLFLDTPVQLVAVHVVPLMLLDIVDALLEQPEELTLSASGHCVPFFTECEPTLVLFSGLFGVMMAVSSMGAMVLACYYRASHSGKM